MPSKPRTCAFVPAAGRFCPHPALPRKPYCHLHAAIHQAAGAVAGGFVSELLSWVQGAGSFGQGHFGGESPYRRPRAEPDDTDPFSGPEFERMLDELLAGLRGFTERARAHAPPGQAPRRQLNYYHVLGVRPTSTTDEIKAAFRKIAFDNHPDRNPGATRVVAIARFKKAAEAYQTLSDPEKRAAFDEMLRYARPVATGG